MGQVLRINFQDRDYSLQLLNEQPVTRETVEIELLLDHTRRTISRSGQKWDFRDEASPGEDASLAEAIGKAIALRYRVSFAAQSPV